MIQSTHSSQPESRHIVEPIAQPNDTFEFSLRPKVLEEYIGQAQLKSNLKVFLEAAKGRGEPIEHMLFYGPPGLGKTTLSNIIAHEMGVSIKTTSGPAIEKQGDLASIITNLKEHDILFIDEIHRMKTSIEEVLYSAMEDYAIDIMIGKGPSARSMRLHLPKFTLIGATTKFNMLSAPLRDRFGHIFKLEYYTDEEIATIISRSADLLNISIDSQGAKAIASRCRKTPRIANRLLKRVRDFAQLDGATSITEQQALSALDQLGVDKFGLDNADRYVLLTMIETFGGRPVGLNTIAAATSEEEGTIEDVYEPFLMQLGFIERTPRGRVATQKAYEHLGKGHLYPSATQQSSLFI